MDENKSLFTSHGFFYKVLLLRDLIDFQQTIKPGIISILVLNPKEGGLFGWSEKKAKERIRNLEVKKNSEEAMAHQERQKSVELHQTSQNLKSEIQKQQNQLAAMDSRLNQLNRELTQKRNLSAGKQAEKKKLENRLNNLKKEVAALQRTRSQNARAIAEKKQRIEELNED